MVGPRADAARIPAIDIEVSEEKPVRVLAPPQRGFCRFPGIRRVISPIGFPKAALFSAGTRFLLWAAADFSKEHREQMWESLGKLAHLPGETRVYCGHEYTEANAAFAVTVDPENESASRCGARRSKNACRRPADDSLNDLRRTGDESVSQGGRPAVREISAPGTSWTGESIRGDAPAQG